CVPRRFPIFFRLSRYGQVIFPSAARRASKNLYSKPDLAGDPKSLARAEQLRAMKQEERKLLEELLGAGCCEDAQPISGRADFRDGLLAFLPPMKRQALRDIEDRYQQLQRCSSRCIGNRMVTRCTKMKPKSSNCVHSYK